MKQLGILTKETDYDNVLIAIATNINSYLYELNNNSGYGVRYYIKAIYEVTNDFPFDDFIKTLTCFFPQLATGRTSFIIPPNDFISLFDSLNKINNNLKRIDNITEQVSVEQESEDPEDNNYPDEKIFFANDIEGNDEYEIDAKIERLTKADCAEMLTRAGFHLNDILTLSSLNKNGKYYWSNAPVEYLNYDWSLMLNDTKNCVLYLFEIKAKQIDPRLVVLRKGEGREHCMQLEFIYQSKTFKEQESGIDFDKFYVGQYHYATREIQPVPLKPTSYKEAGNNAKNLSFDLEHDAIGNIPVWGKVKSFAFRNKSMTIEKNKEMYDYIFDYLYDSDPTLFRKAAHGNATSKYFYFGKPTEDEIENYNKVSNSDIYYSNEIEYDIRKGIRLIKKFLSLNRFNIPLNQFSAEIDCNIDTAINWDDFLW